MAQDVEQGAGPQSGREGMREARVQGGSNVPSTGDERTGDSAVALPGALANLTARERSIFDAGMHAGAARVLEDIAEQHAAFVDASVQQAVARHREALAMLMKVPVVTPASEAGARLGTVVGRRTADAVTALVRAVTRSR